MITLCHNPGPCHSCLGQGDATHSVSSPTPTSTVLTVVFLTQESDHAWHLHKPGSGFASFPSQAVEDVAAVFLFSLAHPLPHVPPSPHLLHSDCAEHAATFHISGYLHIQIFFSILIATPHHCFFWGGAIKHLFSLQYLIHSRIIFLK